MARAHTVADVSDELRQRGLWAQAVVDGDDRRSQTERGFFEFRIDGLAAAHDQRSAMHPAGNAAEVGE